MGIVVHRPRTRRWLALSLGSVAIGVALAWWAAPRAVPSDGAPARAEAVAARAAPTVGGAAEPAVAAPTPVALRTGPGAAPGSLDGTDPPGPLEEDAQGGLKLTRVVRDVFDYFLSTTGEEPVAQQRARVKAWLDGRLGVRAAAQALALYDTYTAYKSDLQAHLRDTRPTTVADMRARVDSLRAARARHFSPEVNRAFFGDEEARDGHSLERIAVLRDPALGPQEKARRLAALRAALPEALRQEQDVVEVVETLGTLTSDLQARAGTPQELRQLRETLVGADAADRLETLDRTNAAWNHRVATYLQQRAGIVGDPTLADSTRQARLDALRSEGFTASERLRLETIERIEEFPARDASPVPRLPSG
jgi:lipase chaperone LimK